MVTYLNFFTFYRMNYNTSKDFVQSFYENYMNILFRIQHNFNTKRKQPQEVNELFSIIFYFFSDNQVANLSRSSALI